MRTINLPGFGDLKLEDDTDNFFEAELQLDDQLIDIELWVYGDELEDKDYNSLSNIVNNMQTFKNNSWQEILNDYENDPQGSALSAYTNHHLKELSGDDLEELFGKREAITEQDFLSQMFLSRVCFYPENASGYAIFEYTIDVELTEHLIVVSYGIDCNFESVAMES